MAEYTDLNSALAAYTKKLKEKMVDLVYPIGSIYMSINPTDPKDLFGGTWERLEDRFLVGAGNDYTVGVDGGSATHKHSSGTLEAAVFPAVSEGYIDIKYKSSEAVAGEWGETQRIKNLTISNSAGSARYNGVDVIGSTSDGDNLPPYTAVYMWKRTA